MARGERPERVGIHQHPGRLVEGARQILARGEVHRRLAADAAVHLRDDGRGHAHPRDPAQVGGGGEAGEVPNHASSERHQRIGARELQRGQAVPQCGEELGALAALARRHAQECCAEPGATQRAQGAAGVPAGDARIAHDHRGARARDGAREGSELRERTALHPHPRDRGGAGEAQDEAARHREIVRATGARRSTDP